MLRFSADDMVSDPPPPPPVGAFSEAPEAPPEKPSRASEWFSANRVTRVPMIALEPDLYRVPDQNWVVFSIIKPGDYKTLHHGSREYSGFLIKFRGVFASREDAEAHIKKVMQIDRHFDVHLVPAFAWSGVDDDAVEDRQYANEIIGSIMKGYFENENARALAMRARIRNCERPDECGERSGEASAFFESCQKDDDCSALERPDPPRAEPGEPVSLAALADQFGITPGGRERGAMQLGRGAAESIVSVALLDE
jgi:hypothetical protein